MIPRKNFTWTRHKVYKTSNIMGTCISILGSNIHVHLPSISVLILVLHLLVQAATTRVGATQMSDTWYGTDGHLIPSLFLAFLVTVKQLVWWLIHDDEHSEEVSASQTAVKICHSLSLRKADTTAYCPADTSTCTGTWHIFSYGQHDKFTLTIYIYKSGNVCYIYW